ncbi:tRNA glutamyl-Q(34) synthetase GluQRS [Ruficoccus sp. ZRK36]|uniref:tRNA glutamyl-Q(34) synthetase GluQRS n=1 Tax=Ruficoccus sp. ZRK36 TaxID=2866311 RepID=UPI002103F376|nr:tRNA glutamyl-Q(34) synthetase GluQRS [Ruficoccus sp. ZRK36]
MLKTAGDRPYRGRLAPTPTGRLHLGHAATFLRAQERCQAADGTLIFRNEDLDPQRCRPEYAQDALDDLRWLGLRWSEGPDCGGPCGPYNQSERQPYYLEAWAKLRDAGVIYPCTRSRRELRERVAAPHEEDEEAEPLYPPEWRPAPGTGQDAQEPGEVNWRFRVPDGERISFEDELAGKQSFTAGQNFGDFLIWRRDGVPAYELSVVVDDLAMAITEVVRGADLIKSTARQLLIYRVLGAELTPRFAHCPLIRDEQGKRLAKRSDALSLRTLRERGLSPRQVQDMAR